LDRQHLIRGQLRLLLLLVVLGHDRLDPLGRLDVDLEVLGARVLRLLRPSAGGDAGADQQRPHHRELQLPHGHMRHVRFPSSSRPTRSRATRPASPAATDCCSVSSCSTSAATCVVCHALSDFCSISSSWVSSSTHANVLSSVLSLSTLITRRWVTGSRPALPVL